MLTRVFQSGNSLAVRIPKELAFMAAAQDVEIERQGDTLVVKPLAQRTLSGLGAALKLFPRDFMAEGRERHEQRERNWGNA
jgi:antitoxin VapB